MPADRYRRTTAALEREADELRDMLINGNRKDAMDRLAALPPMEAVVIALMMAEGEGNGARRELLDVLSAADAWVERHRVHS